MRRPWPALGRRRKSVFHIGWRSDRMLQLVTSTWTHFPCSFIQRLSDPVFENKRTYKELLKLTVKCLPGYFRDEFRFVPRNRHNWMSQCWIDLASYLLSLYQNLLARIVKRMPWQTALTCAEAERLLWSRGSVLAFGTQVRRFAPGRIRRIFRAKKSSARLPSEGEVKPPVPCRSFTACERSLNVTCKSAFRKNYQIFLAQSSTFRRWVLSRGDTHGDAWWWKLERLTKIAQ